MAPNPYVAYRQAQITTADPIDLIILLYEGAIRFTSNAIAALAEREYEQAHRSFVRAQDIVLELLSCLDLEHGAVAKNLAAIYAYLYRQLVEANIRKDPATAREVVRHLHALLASWQQLRQTDVRADGALVPTGGTR
jgi:flagellar protein FliS